VNIQPLWNSNDVIIYSAVYSKHLTY